MTLLTSKIVHIHPTRMCNLACLHCYSDSGPEQRTHANVHQLLSAAACLRNKGYELASISGGEPTVYRDFQVLCLGLKSQNYKVSVITNGMLLQPIINAIDNIHIDLISISFDGPRDVHNTIRGRNDCFDRAVVALKAIAKRGVTAGAVVSVTKQSFTHIPSLVEDLISNGASRIQLHPIAAVGRAEKGLTSFEELSAGDLQSLILMSVLLQSQYPNAIINCDAVMGSELRRRKFPLPMDLVSPIVIDETGNVLPIAYGMAKSFSFGTIQTGFESPVYSQELADLAKKTMIRCRRRKATTFYSDLVRSSLKRQSLTSYRSAALSL